MKKQILHSGILTVLLVVLSFTSFSQITVSKIENRNVSTLNEGFIYSLPKTVFKVDIVYEKTQELVGPLADYTTEYLGVTNYVSINKTEYSIINISVSTFYVSDPNQLYYVQYPAERSKDEKATSFSLSDIGGLIAYNTDPINSKQNTELITDQTFIFESGDTQFPYMSQYNRQEKIDTIIRTINIDTVTINRFLFKSSWIDKSIDDKAKDAALEIEKIRESRYHLISGYQEVNYGSSIIYMNNQLQKLEDQHLELFLGKKVVSMDNQTIYFSPTKVRKGDELIKFSDGSSVVIKIVPDNTSNMLPEVPSSKPNGIYYRIPSSANITISYENEIYYNGNFVVNQLGSISTVPLVGTKLQFDETTGNLTSIIRE
ncbi:MAG: DUF4831 family protein [Bacteroidota bacterium]